MLFKQTNIPEVYIIQPRVFGDERGFFMETWRQDLFDKQIGSTKFVQDNHSLSSKGILRGLHYQSIQPQGKLVRVTRGSVFDVAIDLRKNSPTFTHWVGVELSAENKQMLWVPEGFGHGFYVTSDIAEFSYKCTDFYNPKHEHTLLWNDPTLNISWPIPENTQPILSDKDKAGDLLSNATLY